NPDQGRKNEINMSATDGIFSAEINIPDSAELLSYYVTDGTNFDYNDKKTYTSYIFDNSGKPVKGARFRNIDFLIMAGADNETCIAEIENELKDYPDFHLARFVLWDKKFNNAKSFDDVVQLKNDFEEEFNQLNKKYPNNYELLNAQGRIYYAFQSALSELLMPHYQYATEKIVRIAEQIPEGKRASVVQRIFEMNERQKKSSEFNKDIIGKPSIDFEFVSTKGEQRKLSDYKGKVVLLDFWGTWCGPCVGEIPNLVKAYEKFKGKGFEIISVSSDLMFNSKNEDEFKKFTEERNMSWTHVLDDNNKSIHSLYNITHWPTLYLVGKDGTIIRTESELRGESLEKTLAEVLN
ncbi:MAG TPA: TlpA disulfide reductase family protein, partial [Ignavibacteriaceae bacterium]|nr:TlpA disulfide reductase family protein [Ignavibacteriaceae bacterium]